MSLPNYSPSGKILFGSVPWDNGYTNVRLYQDTGTQYNDIVSRMTVSSDNYTYIGRNRRIKVSIEADRLYHCNYCMYRNDSLTDGYIYCFITDVKYINDNTSEIAIETDVFQTYLYSVDWTIPPCFIERETTPSEDDKYLLTNEPDFSMTFKVTTVAQKIFKPKGVLIVSASNPVENSTLIDAVLNPQGYYAVPYNSSIDKGLPQGTNVYYCEYSSAGLEAMSKFVTGLNYAGSIESIVCMFTVPDFYDVGIASGHWQESFTASPDDYTKAQATLAAPSWGTQVDGYNPRNKKLLYYPYTRLRLTDQNGSYSELKYELMGNETINIKYVANPSCQALAYPDHYMGLTDNFENGITVQCGSLGTWQNNAFQNWIAQNAGNIALTVAGVALSAYTGGTSLAAASELISLSGRTGATHFHRPAHYDYMGMLQQGRQMQSSGYQSLTDAQAGAASLGAQVYQASKAPVTTRGQSASNITLQAGIQGIWAERVQVKAEIAQQIDQFFDRFGYAVERIEQVNITSRPSWNYVKTQGAAPKSTNMAAGTSAPFSRGRGTPTDALSIIRQAFDSGVTFWHTTSNFGDYMQGNPIL